jgi:phosphoglycerol transferase MdoB-like AlkP superfamily enzyme
LYDDQKAVVSTFIEDFHPIVNGLSLIFICLSGILIFRYFEKRTSIYNRLITIQSKYAKITLITLSLIIFFIGMRGSFTKVPAIRKWAAVSSDTFMNKTVVNPFRSFKYALKDFKKLNLIDGKNPYVKKEVFKHDFPQNYVSDIIKKVAKGNITEKPKQIFLVIMESYDSWPLMGKYLPFKLSSNLNQIAKNGTHFTHFLPASESTFNSMGAIVTGVPYCGVNISKIGKINEPFISSIFTQFKKLGYHTNLFYGGYLSWQNIGEFSRYQGADQVFSGLDAKDKAGVWGVEDEELFDLVLENTDPNEYSLNVILTSSYHAPYSIDIYEKGFPYKSEQDLPLEMKQYFDNGMTMEQLGHLWYGDKAIGGFMKKSKDKFSDGLYAFTGDHFGRKFINYNPNLYERSSVPFILYGNNIPKSKNLTPGSHIDIIPTLIEIVAPKDFEYYSFGTSLFSSNKKESIALNKIVTRNDIFYFPTDKKIEKINLSNYNETKIEGQEIMKNHNKMMSLAWYYTIKGDQIN